MHKSEKGRLQLRNLANPLKKMHFPDDAHSIGEQRFVCFGLSEGGRILAVIYTEPSEDRIRIISAREATRGEEKVYETQSDLT